MKKVKIYDNRYVDGEMWLAGSIVDMPAEDANYFVLSKLGEYFDDEKEPEGKKGE